MRKYKPLLAVALSLSALGSAHAFGGEDFLDLHIETWHHADISCLGAGGVGCPRPASSRPLSTRMVGAEFSPGAAVSLAWHADYVDSYGYNPLWWAQGPLDTPGAPLQRLRAALSAKPELEKVHFDDLITNRLNPGRFDRINVFKNLPLATLRSLDAVKPDSNLTARGDLVAGALQGVKLNAVDLQQASTLIGKKLQIQDFEKIQVQKDIVQLLLLERPPRNAVELQMRRYLSGTIDGLMYAASTNDVAMAQHIIGVSLHAIQDFYSHSNWIDQEDRRNKTYFDMATSEWSTLGSYSLWTGTYETPDQLGVSPHGKYAPACTVMNQPGIRNVLDIGCGAFSPISNDDVCMQYKECRKGQSLAGASVYGVTLPNNFLYVAPPGINVDSTWMAKIGARERGLVPKVAGTANDDAAIAFYRIAEADAIKATEQWLRRIGLAMNQLGLSGFWNQVRTVNTVGRDLNGSQLAPEQLGYRKPSVLARNQWEDFRNLGFQFVSAGTYPPKATDPVEEHFLRVKIKTANESLAGTDADIVVVADGKEFVLDNMPTRGDTILKRAIGYNDFEQGDEVTYLVGPMKNMPTSIRIENRAANVGDVVLAAAEAFVNTIIDAVRTVVDGIVGFFKALVGYDPDFVQKGQKVWRFSELPTGIGQSLPYNLRLNGGDEGEYEIFGQIRKVGDSGQNADFVVRVDRMYCHKESKWDRFTSSDEPFFAAFVNALDGNTTGGRRNVFGPYNDVDKGETVNINYEFSSVRIPKNRGVITLPVLLMESDDESGSERNDILNKFADGTDAKAKPKEDGFLDVLGRAIAPDWKVDRIDVWAFSKGDRVRSGSAGSFSNVGWIEGGKNRTFNLNIPAATSIRAQDLENMTGVTLSAQAETKRPLIALLGLTVGASLLGCGLLRVRRERA